MLGIVTAAMGDDYAVDIGSNLPARYSTDQECITITPGTLALTFAL